MKIIKKVAKNVLYNLGGGAIVIALLNIYALITGTSLSFNGWQSLLFVLAVLILGGLIGYVYESEEEE